MAEHRPRLRAAVSGTVKKPPPEPASSCFHCYREGVLTPGQTVRGPGGVARLKFSCVCGASWTTPKAEAEAHGRFLRKTSY